MAPDAPQTPAPEEKKSLFETVVISTPVLLTIIATFLVGQSSTEMTRAQYFRSVASQNQSKVGDQWGFYQAKRIRGQVLDGTADTLLAQKRDMFTRASLVETTQATLKEIRDAKGNLGTAPEWKPIADKLSALAVEGDKLLADCRTAFKPPADGWKGKKHTLKPKNVQAAMNALQNKPDSEAGDADKAEAKEADSIPADQRALLGDVIEDIKKRKAEGEIAPKVLKLTDETLKQAIADADRQADKVYRRGKDIDNVLSEFDELLDRLTALAFEFQRLPHLIKTGPEKVSSDAMEAAEKRADAVRTLHARLQGDYKAARLAYGARRYEDDARSNQDAAYLYEVKVNLSAARSDRHLYRSRMFMLAMLVAQAGVTISTLALALKRKSVFWGMATLIGMIAIAFGAYVYLDLWPIPGI
jgi:hypothetical protein